LFQSELDVDQAAFTAFSPIFSPTFTTDFLDDIQAADAIPTNEDDLNNQTLISNQLEQKMEACRQHFNPPPSASQPPPPAEDKELIYLFSLPASILLKLETM
jgi:hypothetical protein